MHTSDVIRRLRSEGYDITPGYLDFLFRERHLPRPPPKDGPHLRWAKADMDRLRSVLKHRGRGPRDTSEIGGRR